MDYQLIAHISLAVVSFFSLAAMLRQDMISLQSNQYSNKQFMKWLQADERTYSTKRIVPMAALVASATQWARQSWMVVAILAFIILILAAVLIYQNIKDKQKLPKRGIITLIVILAVVAVCGISLYVSNFTLECGMFMLLLTAFSYVPVLMANGVWNLITRNKITQNNTQSTNEEV